MHGLETWHLIAMADERSGMECLEGMLNVGLIIMACSLCLVQCDRSWVWHIYPVLSGRRLRSSGKDMSKVLLDRLQSMHARKGLLQS